MTERVRKGDTGMRNDEQRRRREDMKRERKVGRHRLRHRRTATQIIIHAEAPLLYLQLQ